MQHYHFIVLLGWFPPIPILYPSLGKGFEQELSASEHLVGPKYLRLIS